MQTGIARKMDNLGRFVIPTEIRRSHGIKAGDSLVISVEGRNIVLRKEEPCCWLCGGTEELQAVGFGEICRRCRAEVRGMGDA